MLLDSAFLIDLLAGDDGAATKLEQLIDSQTPVGIPSLVIVEVGVGLSAVSEQQLFEEVVSQIPTHSLSREAAWKAVEIQRDLRQAGKQIGAVDVMVAGTAAVASDPKILTRNLSEFERVGSIETETY